MTNSVEYENAEQSPELTWRERAVRDLFVKEYLVDYDKFAAAVRCGYNASFAQEYAVKFMQEPYVLQQIKAAEMSPIEESEEDRKKRIITGLLREANYKGAGSSQSARVAAWAKLAAIEGLDAPLRSKVEHTLAENEGVFVIPGVMTPEAWAEAAAKQQAALVAGAAPGQPEPTKH